MFISKDKALIIPQDEHAKLAGDIAAHWGNSDFALPPVDRKEFVAGVRYHDSMHGLFDTVVVLDRSERGAPNPVRKQALIELYSSGLTLTTRPVVDALRLLHIMVLTEGLSSEIVRSADLLIDKLTKENGLRRPDLTQTYKLLRACDSIPPTVLHFEVSNSCIIIDPWPLDCRKVTGEIMAYDIKGYPTELKAVPVKYTVMPK
jgi:hypothetical protein